MKTTVVRNASIGILTLILIGYGLSAVIENERRWAEVPEEYLYSQNKTIVDKEYTRRIWYTWEKDSNNNLKMVEHIDEDWYVYFDNGDYYNSYYTYHNYKVGDTLEIQHYQKCREDGKIRHFTKEVWHIC